MEKSEAVDANRADGRGSHAGALQSMAVETMFVLTNVFCVGAEV